MRYDRSPSAVVTLTTPLDTATAVMGAFTSSVAMLENTLTRPVEGSSVRDLGSGLRVDGGMGAEVRQSVSQMGRQAGR